MSEENSYAHHVDQSLPMQLRLWRTAEIAQYLKREKRTVAEKIVCRPGFPAPIYLEGTGHPLWRASDIIEWALGESYGQSAHT